MDLRFDQVIAGIEDGMVNALTNAIGVQAEDGYVKTIISYGGELEENLQRALGVLTPRMPAMLVAYTEGEDFLNPATQQVMPGEPRHFRHDCTFIVFCLDANARGEKQRRLGAPGAMGAYRMIGDAKSVLGGKKFRMLLGVLTEEGEELSEGTMLNGEPLRYAGVDHIGRLPEITAYAVRFDTWFRYSEPDRTQPGQLVDELIIDVENTFEKGEANLPGVKLQ